VCDFYKNSAIYHLTPWSRGLIEKLIVAQMVNNYPAFYGTKIFIIVFMPATGPYPELIEPTPHPHTLFF
jgi:hypothetical protein